MSEKPQSDPQKPWCRTKVLNRQEAEEIAARTLEMYPGAKLLMWPVGDGVWLLSSQGER